MLIAHTVRVAVLAERGVLMADFNYKKDMVIDRFLLDEEWEHLPQLLYDYGVEAANAVYNKLTAKATLETVRAQCATAYRADFSGRGVRFTEAVIQEHVQTDSKVLAAQERAYVAEQEHALVQAALTALLTKRSALEQLVKLFLASYYTTPGSPKSDVVETALGHFAVAQAEAAQQENVKRVMTARCPQRT